MGRSTDLPDDIIHKIIADHLLRDPTDSNKTAVRLSLLSKEILCAVNRRPALVFEWSHNPRCTQELNYLLSTLIRYDKENIHLDTLKFIVKLEPSLESYSCLDRCIELAASNNLGLKNLTIRVHPYYPHVLPRPVFEVESLVQLHLMSCRLQPADESIIMWPNLKILRLHTVEMVRGVFESIIRRCPLIEILDISYSWIGSSGSYINFKVSNLVYLKQLAIRLYGDVTFELDRGAASNLEFLACSYPDFFQANVYHKLRSLSVSHVRALDADFIVNLAHQFPVLEELSMDNIDPDVKRIKISSPSLKKIKLKKITGLDEASFNVPNILLFEFDSYVVPKLTFAGNSGGCTNFLITLRIHNHDKDTSWSLKLKEFLAAINMPTETSFHASFEEGFTYLHIEAQPQKSADYVSFPGIIQHQIKPTLIFHRNSINDVVSVSFINALLDGIFPICLPERISIVRWPDCEFPKLLYDNLMLTRCIDEDDTTNFLMWDVTGIHMRRDWDDMLGRIDKFRIKNLELSQVWSRGEFLELFKVDPDDRNNKFTVDFELKYYTSGICSEQRTITSGTCELNYFQRFRRVKRWVFSQANRVYVGLFGS